MMTLEDATRAHRAAVKLARLYHAYRATERAVAMVIHRVEGQVASDTDMDPNARHRRQAQLAERKALARRLDLAFAERITQLEGRTAELRRWSQ